MPNRDLTPLFGVFPLNSLCALVESLYKSQVIPVVVFKGITIDHLDETTESLSTDVFEPWTPTGSRNFSFIDASHSLCVENVKF